MRAAFAAAYLLASAAAAVDAEDPDSLPLPASSLRVAFGSCSQTTRAQPLWPSIAGRGPDLFLWLGDIIYADTPVFAKWRRPATLDAIAREYAAQHAIVGYADFLARGGRGGRAPLVTGVWDDHDLGVNDGDERVSAAFKAASQKLLLDFLGEPRASPRRSRVGAFGAWDVEVPADGGAPRLVYEGGARAPAASLAQRVRVILLDVRTHRAPWGGASHDMLGAAQWAWLEDALLDGARAGTAVTLVGSGLQVVAPGDPPITEEWARAPGALARLVALLAHTRTRGAVLLSGDVHFGELNVAATKRLLGYRLWEVTSSGLTHAWDGVFKGTGVALATLGTTRAALPAGAPWTPGSGARAPPSFCASNLPWSALGAAALRALGLRSPADSDPGLCLYSNRNWGEIDVSADAVVLRVWGEDGAVHIAHTVGAADLDRAERDDAFPADVVAACAHANLSAGVPAACAPILAEILPCDVLATLRQLSAHAVTAFLLVLILAGAAAAPVLLLRALRAAPKLAPAAPPVLVQAAVLAAAAVLIPALLKAPASLIFDSLMK
jgi:alkaline phosphatase D